MSKLFIVGTPIGNLGDMTYRAVEILKSVDLVLCEDTSVTQRIFKEYGINTPTSVFYANSKIKDLNKALNFLESGKSIALVSDAGTPTISDPGFLLVEKVYSELEGVEVIAIPGPSALISALSVSGISSANFTFYGFFPHKKGRETLFKKIKESDVTSVFYESVHRIEKTLESLEKYLDLPVGETGDKRLVVVARELTKIHEEVVRGNIKEVKSYFDKNKDKIRGEFVVIVAPKSGKARD